MEAPPRTPLKTTNAYLKLQGKLLEIEAEVIQFINLPSDTPHLDRLVEDIEKKFVFFKSFLTAETGSHGSTSHDFSEIEERLEELEAEFAQSNSHSHSAIVHEDEASENSSGSVCDHCSNRVIQVPIDAGNEKWKVYENPALYEAIMSPSEMYQKSVVPPSEMFHKSPSQMLHKAVMPQSEMNHEAVMPPSEMIHEAVMPPYDLEDAKEAYCDCEREQTDGCKKRGRRWWRTLVVVTTVSVVSTVSFSIYINSDQHEGFLTPT